MNNRKNVLYIVKCMVFGSSLLFACSLISCGYFVIGSPSINNSNRINNKVKNDYTNSSKSFNSKVKNSKIGNTNQSLQTNAQETATIDGQTKRSIEKYQNTFYNFKNKSQFLDRYNKLKKENIITNDASLEDVSVPVINNTDDYTDDIFSYTIDNTDNGNLTKTSNDNTFEKIITYNCGKIGTNGVTYQVLLRFDMDSENKRIKKVELVNQVSNNALNNKNGLNTDDN